MIFVITDYPNQTSSYLVATDDFALKVKGTFLDALQSLMELHYIFDLAYAKELKPFFILMERLASININKTFSTINDLYGDLQRKADSICASAPENPVADAPAPQNPAPDEPSDPVAAPNALSPIPEEDEEASL
uniref:Uncharacterized protein n=1 Tax=Panagrolaimus superbus TaxID=310955 RepID=A0A914YBI2_9BILA